MMVFFIVIWIAVFALLLSRFLFRKWFNHLSIYTTIWSVMICLYELKLLGYYDLSAEAWTMIASSFLSFVFGILTIFIARNTFGKTNDINQIVDDKPDNSVIFAKDGKYLRNAIVVLSIIGLLSAVQHWIVLIRMFGSVQNVLLKANLIYKMRIDNEIPGVIPYIFIASYSAVFLAAVYTAYKSKFSLLSILPLVGVMLKEIANIGRAGILLAFFEFGITLILFRFIFSKHSSRKVGKIKRNLAVTIIIATVLMVASVSLIRSVRGTIETYQTATRQLNKMRSGLLITPSIYIYSSSHIVVFSKYLEADRERRMFGANTFMPVYSMIAKFGLVEQPSAYDQGYLTPIWSNTGTYLRDIHADFGLLGIFIVPFLLGLLSTFYWFRFYERNSMIDLTILVYLYLIVSLSFLNIASRTSIWGLSFILLITVIVFTRKLLKWKGKYDDKDIQYIF